MKLKRSTHFYLFIMATFIASNVKAQDPIVSYTFDEDLDGWTAVGISSADPDKTDATLWIWENMPTAKGAFAAGLTINSESGGGGVIFDSDFLDNAGLDNNFTNGESEAPHRGELISPSLDFSANMSVRLSFIQSYAYFQGPAGSEGDPASRVEVSNDGGTTWTEFFVNEDIGTNTRTAEGEVVIIDISDVAAGQSDVLVKFVWDGNYYYWIVDDVKFFEEVGVDLSILEFTRANQFITPQAIANGDSIDLEVLVTNKGTADSDSIQFLAVVLDPADNVIFRDTGLFEGIAAGDTIIWDYDVNFSTDGLEIGEDYTLIYDISEIDTTSVETVNPDDNIDGTLFDISETTLAFTPGGSGTGFSGSAISGLPEDFEFANIFRFNEGATSNLIIDSVSFECFMPTDVDGDLAPRSVLAYVVQFPDSVFVSGDLLNGQTNVNFNDDLSIDNMVEEGYVVGIGNYAFTNDDGRSGQFSVPVVDFEEGEGSVTLEPGFTYMLVISYPGISNVIVQEINTTYELWQLGSIAYYPSAGGWIGLFEDQTPVIDASFTLDEMVSSTRTELPENSVKVFPNPSTDYIQLNIALENIQDATIYVTDANGRILTFKQYDQVENVEDRIDVQAFPAGSYTLRLETQDGVASRSFIVSH